MQKVDPVLTTYLAGTGPFKLEIGAGPNAKPGWMATDLNPRTSASGVNSIQLDATKPFPINSNCFDYVFTEHMIEHINFDQGQIMLKECLRILKPGGIIRVVTPSIGFMLRVMSPDRSPFEDRYREWSIKHFVRNAPKVTNAFFLNNFMRAWGHTFVYDRETLELAMQMAGFQQLTSCDINVSAHDQFRGIENEGRMPAGFLDLESMIIEGQKPL